MQFIPETELLRPRDPSLVNSDDWPILSLSHVQVHAIDHTPATLLHADAQNALTIQGKLEPVPREHEHLRQRPSLQRTQPIEITEVRQFAYGQYADGTVEIWAAGQAGWFAIKPSRAYKETYEDMVEAIQLLYFIVDAYTAPISKSRKGKPTTEGYRGDVTAQDVFQKWANKTPETGGDRELAAKQFYKHRHFLLASMLSGKEGLSWSLIPVFRHLEHQFPDLVESLRNRLAHMPAKRRKSATPRAGSTTGKRKRGSSASIQPVSPPQEARRQAISSEDKATRGRGRPRRTLEGVGTFDGASDTIVVGTSEASSLRMSSNADSEEDTSELPEPGHKGKSSLRPRASKYIPKQVEDEDMTEESASPTPAERLAAVSRISPPKRANNDDMGFPRLKGRNSRRGSRMKEQTMAGAEDVDEGIDMPLDQEHDDNSLNMTIPNNDSPNSESLVFRLRKEDLTADGEGDKWTCPLDGCMHAVYAASDPASQKLIKEHYRVHVDDEDADMRMQLVRRMQAPGLPVSRLMSRIQMMSGQRFPVPIKRRY